MKTSPRDAERNLTMDNLTHTLVGVLMARAGLNRLVPGAMALLIAGANLPDGDVVTYAAGPLTYFQCHRGPTHALLAAPLVALIALPVWWLCVRRKHAPGLRQFVLAFAVVLAGVLSHLFLDFWNTYGIRLLLPLSGEWYRLDLVYIVDLWIWALLLVGCFAPIVARMVYAEIGARRTDPRRSALVVLGLLLAFIGVRAILHQRVIDVLESRTYDSENARRVAALPQPFAPWKWTGLVETRRAWHVVPVDLNQEFDPDAGRSLLKPEAPLREEAAIRASRTGRIFLNFTRFPYWRATPSPRYEGGTVVRVTDLRFGLPEEARFAAEFEFDAAGRMVREEFAPPVGGKN
jgi:inner membrane protein